MKRRCRMCKEPHARQHPLCGSCVKVKAAHKNEVMRQESRLYLRGWLPSGMATGYPPTTAVIIRSNTDTSTSS